MLNYSFSDFWAVFTIEVNNFTIWFISSKYFWTSISVNSLLDSSLSQYLVSLASFDAIDIFDMKSFLD